MSARDEHGVSVHVRNSELAQLLDTPMPKFVTHLRVKPRHGFARSFCGEDTQDLTDATDCVTCEACKAEAAKRTVRSEFTILKRLAKGGVLVSQIHRETRWRLESAGHAKVVGARVLITGEGLSRLREGK